MNKIYDQTIEKINSHPNPEKLCSSYEKQAVELWKDKFLHNAELYGSQNGNYPPPKEILMKYIWGGKNL